MEEALSNTVGCWDNRVQGRTLWGQEMWGRGTPLAGLCDMGQQKPLCAAILMTLYIAALLWHQRLYSTGALSHG